MLSWIVFFSFSITNGVGIFVQVITAFLSVSSSPSVEIKLSATWIFHVFKITRVTCLYSFLERYLISVKGNCVSVVIVVVLLILKKNNVFFSLCYFPGNTSFPIGTVVLLCVNIAVVPYCRLAAKTFNTREFWNTQNMSKKHVTCHKCHKPGTTVQTRFYILSLNRALNMLYTLG